MKEAPFPPDERDRLEELRRLNILDTPAEERFDRITRLARRIFDVPIALVSLVDTGRQWFKSCQGLEVRETPRGISFCGHTVLGPGSLVVPDAWTDSRFADNPLVTGEPGIRFYAGHPVTGPGGSRLGTLCIIDRRPRSLDGAGLQTLRDLAALVEAEFRVVRMSWAQQEIIAECDLLRRQALVDPLTHAWNRRAILEVLDREFAQAVRLRTSLGVVMVDLDHFKGINDSYGHPAGDSALIATVRRMRTSLRPYDALGRYGGEEFLGVLPGADLAAAGIVAERMRADLEREPLLSKGSIELRATISLGVSAWDGGAATAASMIAAADAALLEAKRQGRNRVRMSGPARAVVVGDRPA